jgi:ankyrin repeat protein
MYFQNEYQPKGYALVALAVEGDVEGVRRALADNADIVHFNDDLPVRAAAFTGNMATLEVIVEKGGNIRANSDEALLYAAKRGDMDMTRYLLSKGASVEVIKIHHAAEVDDACLDTINAVQSEKSADAWRDNMSALKGNLKNRRRFAP